MASIPVRISNRRVDIVDVVSVELLVEIREDLQVLGDLEEAAVVRRDGGGQSDGEGHRDGGNAEGRLHNVV